MCNPLCRLASPHEKTCKLPLSSCIQDCGNFELSAFFLFLAQYVDSLPTPRVALNLIEIHFFLDIPPLEPSDCLTLRIKKFSQKFHRSPP